MHRLLHLILFMGWGSGEEGGVYHKYINRLLSIFVLYSWLLIINKKFFNLLHENQKESEAGTINYHRASKGGWSQAQDQQVHQSLHYLQDFQCTLLLTQNFFIKEEMLSKTFQKQVPHESYFEFNRIIKGKVVGNFIEFTVIPTSREFEFNDDYIIARFLSFGDQKYKKFADTMLTLKDLRKEIKSVINEFPKLENVIERFNSQKPMIVLYDDPANFSPDVRSASGSLFVSLPYMKRYGWTNAQ